MTKQITVIITASSQKAVADMLETIALGFQNRPDWSSCTDLGEVVEPDKSLTGYQVMIAGAEVDIWGEPIAPGEIKREG